MVLLQSTERLKCNGVRKKSKSRSIFPLKRGQVVSVRVRSCGGGEPCRAWNPRRVCFAPIKSVGWGLYIILIGGCQETSSNFWLTAREKGLSVKFSNIKYQKS